MVLAMCPPDNCACSKDQEPAAMAKNRLTATYQRMLNALI
jgi:hypothetical protein